MLSRRRARRKYLKVVVGVNFLMVMMINRNVYIYKLQTVQQGFQKLGK